MTGIDLFLNTEIRNKEYMYGYENLHYGIFKIILDIKCKEFFEELIGLKIDFDNLKYEFQPNAGLFDFMIDNNGFHYFWEMKIWNQLSQEQFKKQKEFIENEDAFGVYVLFTKSCCTWIKNDKNEEIDKMIDGKIIMVGEKAVLNALGAIKIEIYHNDVKEIVEGYKKVIDKIYGSY